MAVMSRDTRDTYLQRVAEFPLRRLRDDADHGHAVATFARLGGGPLDGGTTEYLDVLAGLIADYERRAGVTIDTADEPAAAVIEHLMAENDLTADGLADAVGISRADLSAMLAGRRPWDAPAIRGVADRFGLNPLRFLPATAVRNAG